ncbi:ATP-binding cassette domain-containing protein [Gorillibacterium sp. sgz5001074]|uniref:ATP-binding cassette domain-containing protein n=1 Tax=Gorillibacterium sp. sgz5001074 TaxID=3446695 RepID=UPI003F665A79
MKGIVLEKVSYRSSGGSSILHGLDLHIRPGEITLIAGRAGAGKSTLLQVMAGLRKPDMGGEVRIGDEPLWGGKKPNPALIRKIGYVHQVPEHQFFLPSVREELEYSLKPFKLSAAEQEHRIRTALQHCGLSDELLDRTPFFLSGGEKRKAALASVWVTEPEWLLLDEPSSGLDPAMGAWLADRLIEWKRSKGGEGGVVIATHDLDVFLPVADRVVMLLEGTVFGSWTASELERLPDLWEDAGIGMTDSIKLAAWTGSASGENGFSVSALADRWMERLQARTEPLMTEPEEPNAKQHVRRQNSPNGLPWKQEPLSASSRHSNLNRLDPRTKWLIYLMFSAVVLLQPVWTVTSASMLMVIGLGVYAGIKPDYWLKPLTPMLLFMLLSFGIAGLELSLSIHPVSVTGVHFVWSQGEQAIERLASFLPVMAAGILFGKTTDPITMQKGLEKPLQAFPRLRRVGQVLAWSTSLMFRFMRWVPTELERFAMLAASRGKRAVTPGKIRLSQLPAFFTPLLLAAMQHAEDVALAMEARGHTGSGQERTNAVPLHFTRQDGTAFGIGIVMVGILVLAGRF